MLLRKTLLATGLVAVLGSGIWVGNAASQDGQEEPVPANHVFPAIRAANGARQLMIQQSNGAAVTTSSVWTNFTNDTISVPATGTYRVLVRVSGESSCSAAQFCTMKVRVRNVDALPDSDDTFAFDSPGGDQFDSNSFERISAPIPGGAGNVAVTVDWMAVGGGSFRMDDWTVTAELWRV